jgi:hypothetical protein
MRLDHCVELGLDMALKTFSGGGKTLQADGGCKARFSAGLIKEGDLISISVARRVAWLTSQKAPKAQTKR